LTSTLAATLRVSLRRTLAAWPIVLAAGLTCLLAASLLAAGPIYAEAVSLAGLHRVLADAPVDEANVQLVLRTTPADADATDRVVDDQLRAAMADVEGPIERFARSDSFSLPVSPSGPQTDLVELAAADGLEAHATLVDGAWPTAGTATGPVPVIVTTSTAASLGLRVGDEFRLESRLDPDVTLPTRIVGIAAIDDPNDPYWWADPQVIDGVVTSDAYATHGPFFTTRDQLLERAVATSVELIWRAFPATDALTVDGIDRLRRGVTELDARTEAALGGTSVTVTTGIPAILTDAERSLLVSRTGVLVLVIQLTVLAAYAVLLSAALLVEHRRVDTAMLRSRGAGPGTLVTMTVAEGLLLVLPAALLGPWVATIALGLFNVVGPLAAIGLRIDPMVSVDAYLAAIAAAVGCLVALVIPALPTRRSFASVRRGVSRASRIPAGQRIGLDIALVAVAIIGLWQLRQYGAPLTQRVQGTVGIDPLLVATPAIALLAGAVLALRVLPMTARLIERATARRRGLVAALGARQLARRPLRYTRASLLLMLAMSMGVFAVSYTWTWTASQHDQAAFQVGAAARVEPGRGSGAPPRWSLEHSYASLAGITAATPVDRAPVDASRSVSGELLALDAVRAPDVVVVRPDLTSATLGTLLAPLAAARPDVDLVSLPGEPRRLRVTVESDIRGLEQVQHDADTDTFGFAPADPALVADLDGMTVSAVVRDGSGLLYRFSGATVGLGPGRQAIEIALGDPQTTDQAFTAPLELLAIDIDLTLPADMQATDARFTVASLAAADEGGPWTDVPLTIPGGWRLTTAVQGAPHQVSSDTFPGDALTATIGGAALPVLGGIDQYGRGTVLTVAPAGLATAASAPIPAIATGPFLEAASRSVGERMMVEIAGVRRTIELTGAVDAFPSIDFERAGLIVDLPTLALARFEGSDAVDPASEWWFAVADEDLAATADALAGRPFASRAVLTLAGRERALATDPVALGIIGALAIGFVAAAAFAIVGFVVSAAVSARERVTEFALLRALGLSPRQLSGWLTLENTVLAVVSLVAGTLLGLVIAWVVLPFVTVTAEARPPFPPVDVETPWSLIVGLELIALVALVATVVVLAWLLRRVGLASVLRTGED
jgi:FtsX-like permease family